VIDFTGPQPVLDESEPPVTGRRARHGDRLDEAPDERGSGRRATAQRLPEADTDDAAKTPRSRRRVGWRKGTDVDQELWPSEAFGGVTDEQFWDDLAADKPLATTARTAQPETSARRPLNAGPLPDLHPAGSPLPDLRSGDDRSREDGRRPASDGQGTHPQPRLGSDDRTAIQPAMRPAVQPAATAATATQPYPTATQPTRTATQPVRAAQQPAGSRRRSRATISADEDPLTSPAYSLRAKGSVDGRSRRPRDLSREQYEAAVTQETQTFSMADAQVAGGGYPDGGPPFRQSDRPAHSADGRGRSDPPRSGGYRPDPLRSDPLRSDPLRPGDGYGGTVPNTAYPYPYPQPAYGEPTSSVNTPPYSDRYGYGNPVGQASPAGDPRRANGGWSPGQVGGNGAGDGNRASRPGYPPVNGYRGPYDPQGYDRRLTTRR
jgi:hypothetical protein